MINKQAILGSKEPSIEIQEIGLLDKLRKTRFTSNAAMSSALTRLPVRKTLEELLSGREQLIAVNTDHFEEIISVITDVRANVLKKLGGSAFETVGKIPRLVHVTRAICLMAVCWLLPTKPKGKNCLDNALRIEQDIRNLKRSQFGRITWTYSDKSLENIHSDFKEWVKDYQAFLSAAKERPLLEARAYRILSKATGTGITNNAFKELASSLTAAKLPVRIGDWYKRIKRSEKRMDKL